MTCPEPGAPDPAGFAAASLRVLLCRLSTYRQVLPSVTHRALLWAARRVPGVYADLAFRPPGEGRERRSGAGWIAEACGEPARAFDVLGITLTVPQEALNLPRLLHASNIPLGTSARAADPACPLVLLGGHSAGVAPFLHGAFAPAGGAADEGLVDAVVVGYGLRALQETLAVVAEAKARGLERAALLRELAARVPGTYVPSLVEHAVRDGRLSRIRARGEAAPLPVTRRNDPFEAWRGYDGAFIPWSDAAEEETLPVALGCPHRCRFCRDGWASGPHRQADADLTVDIAIRMKAALAVVDLNLLSPDLGCQRGLLPLLERLLRIYPRLSAKSLAGISLVRSPALATLLPRLGKREISVGVEGASARLRRYLGKRFDARALPRLLGPMARAGLRQAKLFFIATGLEQPADFEELGELLAAIVRGAPRLRVLVSTMPFFPAPGTPLGFAPLRPLEDSLRGFRTAARTAGAEFRLSASPAEIRATALVTRAGRAATAALVRASLDESVVYDDELRSGDAAMLVQLLVRDGIDATALADEIPASRACPWDDIDLGTPRRTLRREYERSLIALAEPGAEEDESLFDDGSRPAADLASPATFRDIPDPFAKRAPFVLVFHVEPGAAHRPALTLARGAMREWLLRDAAASLAFAAVSAPLGVVGTSGLRLVAVEFASSFVPQLPPDVAARPAEAERSRPAHPVGSAANLPRHPWFLAHAADAARFDLLRRAVQELRPPVRHRVERTAAGRRLVVDKGFWNRCGIAAAHAGPQGLHAFLAPAAEAVARRLAEAGPPLAVVAVLDAEPSGRCPVCRGPLLAAVAGRPASAKPVCPACGVGEDASGPSVNGPAGGRGDPR
jgi:radical SAM superfamily enzyme YgiQ (UPF0313 family)